MQQHRLFPYLCLCLASLFWGLSFVATKNALTAFTPMTLLGLRFAGSTVLFAALVLRKGLPRIGARTHLKIFFLSLFMPASYFLCETYGIMHTTASKASLIDATIPLGVLVASAILLKEKIGVRGIIGVLMSLVGVSLLVLTGVETGPGLTSLSLGDIYMGFAVFAAIGYMLLAREIGKVVPTDLLTGMQMAYGLLYFTPFFWLNRHEVAWDAITPSIWISLAGLIVFATFGAFLAYNYALSRISASRASLFINAVPVVTAVAAWTLLGERLALSQIFGGVLVVVSVYLATFTGTQKNSEPHRKPFWPLRARTSSPSSS